MNVPTYTKNGTKATTSPKLDASVFGVTVKNNELLKQAYVSYLANGRVNLAKTLKRGEVRGGGKKPWKQKGTGRARFGSIRVPIWRGGGITFGPLGEENYSKKLPLHTKRTAIRQALSLKANAGAIVVVEDIVSKEGKTNDTVAFLKKIGLEKGSILIAVETKTPELERSIRNLKKVQLVQSTYLNVYNVMNADTIVFTQKGLQVAQDWLAKAKETN